ncbi:MAG: phenylalanine--tRNA ligase subunit alpha [Terrimesophilobacter sp.]
MSDVTASPDNPITESAVSAAKDAALVAIAAAGTMAELKAARSRHAGENSPLAALNAELRAVPNEQKAASGKLVGQARAQLSQAIEVREAELAAREEAAQLDAETVDVTALPSRWRAGARHPLNLLMEQIGDIFVGMGWEVAEGPELENEWFNFDALNTDADHPARSEQDTFFVEPIGSQLVLRSQTSPVQIRSLLTRELPVYVIAPGKVFRKDELDATHTPVFHQVEGIAIDKGLTMAHLRGTLEHFARLMFGEEAKIRLRPNFFPFTEPSAEMDVWQPHAKGGARWIEWGGCGMVNRNVLRAAGVDPDVYQGFAFGMGIERTLMFRNEELKDMRDIVEGDIRFSQQFGMVV